MKKIVFIGLIPFFCLSTLSAQYNCPKSAKEDTENVMSEAYWQLWNSDVQKKIDKDIDAYRKGDAFVNISDVKKGSEVKVEQVKSDFIFGAHIFNFNQLGKTEWNNKYKDVFGDLFNSATVAFFWKIFESQPGRLRFVEEYWDTEDYWNHQEDPKRQFHWRRPAADKVVDFCKSKGIRVHGHPMIWGNRKWHNPDWIISSMMTTDEKKEMDGMILEYGNVENYLDNEVYNDTYKNMTADELADKFPNFTKTINDLFEKRVVDLAKHYGGKIDSWDVVNESSNDYAQGLMVPGSRLCKSTYGLMPGDYTYKTFQTAQRVFPDNVKLNINDYNTTDAYVNQVKDLRSRGCDIDIIGSQMHLFDPQQCIDISQGKELQTPKQVYEVMERIGSVGLPIHLSEITITAPNNDEKGQKIQAIIARNLYRLWFSIKPMMGITWWNIVDDCGAPGEPSVSGLFNRDMTPKPAYFVLEDLIKHEWRTNLTLKADKNGNIRFRGFKGTYKITYTDQNGESQSIEYHLE